MAQTQTIKPATGDKVFRMHDGPLKDSDGNALPNTAGNKVKFKVEYPKDFKDAKYMKDGDVHNLHVIHAGILEEKGFGKILKDK
jgi:hypothetical protein